MATRAGADTLFRIGGDAESLKRAARDGSNSLSRLGRTARAGTTTLAKYTAAAAVAGAAITANLVNKARQAIDEQAKLSQQLDTTFKSMSTLSRAGELLGIDMNQVSVAGRTLAVRIGEAQQGLASAEQAFEALQLDAKALADLPLDERLATINRALRDNVEASQRAAIAADLFGVRNATAIQQMQPEVLAQARREAELYGLALSDVDAAKVEAANDALSGAANVLKGIVTQITVQVAPVIEALSKQFTQAATAGEGIGEKTGHGFSFIVDSAAFVVDAIEGIKRVFQGVADVAVGTGAGVKNALLLPIEQYSNIAKNAPGVIGEFFQKVHDNTSVQMTETAGVVNEAIGHIKELLEEPLPGTAFKEFVRSAEEAATASAEAVVKARGALSGGGEGEENPMLEKQREQMEKRLEQLRESFMTEGQLLKEKHQNELDQLDEFLQQKLITEQEYRELAIESLVAYEDRLTEIEENAARQREQVKEAEEAAKRQLTEDGLSKATALLNSESRKMFEIGKAAAISQAVMKTYQSAANALGDLQWPLNIAVAAANLAYGFQQVQAIRKQQFGGGGAGAQATGSNTAAANAASTPVNGGAGGQQTVGVIRIQGVNPNDQFSGNQMRDFAGTLKGFLDDGGRDIIFE